MASHAAQCGAALRLKLTSDSHIRSIRCTRSWSVEKLQARSHFVLYIQQTSIETNPFGKGSAATSTALPGKRTIAWGKTIQLSTVHGVAPTHGHENRHTYLQAGLRAGNPESIFGCQTSTREEVFDRRTRKIYRQTDETNSITRTAARFTIRLMIPRR